MVNKRRAEAVGHELDTVSSSPAASPALTNIDTSRSAPPTAQSEDTDGKVAHQEHALLNGSEPALSPTFLAAEGPQHSICVRCKLPYLDGRICMASNYSLMCAEGSDPVVTRSCEKEEKDLGAGLIGQTIPDVAETEPRLNREKR